MAFPSAEWTSTRAGRVALAALTVSAALALWTLVDAIRIDPVPDAAPPSFASEGALASAPRAAAGGIEAAVETDLFSPDRTAPEQRYRVPGEADPSIVATVDIVQPTVLGTGVAGPGHSFATCRLGGAAPTICRVGDHVGEYTVKSIERGRVVFTRAGKLLEVPALQRGS